MKTYGRFSEISDDFSDFKQKNMGGVREALRQGRLGCHQLQHRFQVKNIQTDNMRIIIFLMIG